MELEILRINESGAVDSWDWVGTLTRTKGGNYSFILQQELYPESLTDGPFQHSLDEFLDGSDLFDFIQGVWMEEHFEGLEENEWSEIIQSLEKIDTKLSESLKGAMREEFDPEPVRLSPEEEWAHKATWQRKKFGPGGGAQWASIADLLKGRAAILFYTKRYKEKHNELPTGSHHIRGSLGSLADGADLPPPQQVSGTTEFERDVNFPDQ